VTAETRTVVADQDTRSRSQLRRLLESNGFIVTAEAADAAQAVATTHHHRPALCVIDVEIVGGGIRAISEISLVAPEVAIVVYTNSVATDHLFGALRAGAKGYLLKDTDPARLPLALKGALNGEAAIPRALIRHVLEDYRTRPPARSDPHGPLARLTTREWEVLELMRQGLSTPEIAERLYISQATVRSHVAGLLRKTGVSRRSDAIQLIRGR
jgi:DNA-binding NarL/FixJ family response regulator